MELSAPTLPSAELSRPVSQPRPARGAAELRAAAEEFEAVFLAEMFQHAGLGEARESFGGGVGEEAFASMMATEWARALVDNGGIGLTEHIFQALQDRQGTDV